MPQKAKHVAIIMDGNGRWATAQSKPRLYGHGQGVTALYQIVKAAIANELAYLTVFAFSRDNASRSKHEVSGLIGLFHKGLEQYLQALIDQGVRLRFIGDLEGLDERLAEAARDAEEKTRAGCALTLNVALNYSGSWHITQAVRALVKSGDVLTDDLIVQTLDQLLPSKPDLLIRTGGEQRLSDFMMYHLAYTELMFEDVFWPEFTAERFDLCLQRFMQRDRRFGQVEEKVC